MVKGRRHMYDMDRGSGITVCIGLNNRISYHQFMIMTHKEVIWYAS
jgi:hypothetical protein